MKTKPADEPSKLKAGITEGPALLHASPAVSSPTAVEDLRPKCLHDEHSKVEPEPADDPVPLRTGPAVSSSVADWGPKTLWDEAYNVLRERDAKLMDAYEKDLLVSQDPDQQGTSMQIGFSLAESIRYLPFLSVELC